MNNANNEHYKTTVEQSTLTREDIHTMLGACVVIRNCIETKRVFASSGGICFHLAELTNTNVLSSPILNAFRVFAETWEHYVNSGYMVPAPEEYIKVHTMPVCTDEFAAANYYADNNYVNNPDGYKDVFWYEGEYAESRFNLLKHVIREATRYLESTQSEHQKMNFDDTQTYIRLHCLMHVIKKYASEKSMPSFAIAGACCIVNKVARARLQFTHICELWPLYAARAYVVPSGDPDVNPISAYRLHRLEDCRVDYMWHEGVYAENRMKLIDFAIEWLDNNSTQLVY